MILERSFHICSNWVNFSPTFFFSVFSGRHWVSLGPVCKGLMPFFLAKAIGVDFQRRNHAWLSTSCWGLGSAESCDAHPIGCFSYWFNWFTVNMFEPTTRLGKNDHFTTYLSYMFAGYIFAGYMYQTAVFGVQESDASQTIALHKSFQNHYLSGGMTSFNHVQPIYAQLLKISWVTSPRKWCSYWLAAQKRSPNEDVPVINSPCGQTGVRNPLLTHKDCEMQIMIQLVSPSTWMCGPHKSDPWFIIHIYIYKYHAYNPIIISGDIHG